MEKSKEYYRYLIKRYLSNNCNPQEAEELLDFLNHNESNKLLLQEMKASFDDELRVKDSAVLTDTEWEKRIRQTLAEAATPPAAVVVPFHKKWLPKIAAAAVIVLAASLTFFWLNNKQLNNRQLAQKTTQQQNDILPGRDQAVLTLADGSVIILDKTGNGNIAKQGSTVVDKKNGTIIYDASTVSSSTEISYNTIQTPRGGQYQVVLPDGSKVWLNAASSLRFPTAFTGASREVELTGEGYFEIEKNPARPFHVKVNSMEVEVLGTHFNVMAYGNEKETETTLLEGSVKINYKGNSKMLKPGQQGSLNLTGGNINVASADVDEAVAWKNGLFQFSNADLKTIMRQFERWYDVDVSFEGTERPRQFSGEIDRNVNLSQALKILEQANVKFRITDKKLVMIY
ncbi:MAG: FecR family protein [Lacibacter sp.]